MREATHPWHSIGVAGERPSDEIPQVRIELLWDSIAQSLNSEDSGKQRRTYSSFEEAALLAFAKSVTGCSRFAGPVTPTNRLISEALSLVMGSADAAAAVLRLAPQLLPNISGATPSVAWGLIDVIETALWCIKEDEFSLRRAGRLLLLQYLQSQHSILHHQHALAMSLYLAPLDDIELVFAGGNAIPLVVRLLVAMGQRGGRAGPDVSNAEIENLYWSTCHYTRLAVNAIYGLRVPTLLELDRSCISLAHELRRTEPGGSSFLRLCDTVALVLLARCDATEEFDFGSNVSPLIGMLSSGTDKFCSIDGPALKQRNELELVVDSVVWLLALRGMPPPLRDNKIERADTYLASSSAVTILCAGTSVFSPHTCIGACLLLRSFARSVHSLRTEQVVSIDRTQEFCAALKRMLTEEPENGLDEAVAGLLCNLLVEFSRLREPLIESGIISAMCEALSRNQSPGMLVNTLWALRNVCALRDAIQVEQVSLRSLDRVGALKPLLENEDQEVMRLFCGLLGNISPRNLGELSRLIGGRSVFAKYLTERLELWEWPSVQEAASQAWANLIAAFVTDESDDDLSSRELCRSLTRCLRHSKASETLLANLGYIVSNALTVPVTESKGETRDDKGSHNNDHNDHNAVSAAQAELIGRRMLEEGVYEALTRIDSPHLSVRNSLISAGDALKKVAGNELE